ncbi:ciliary basal body-associated, B9 protein-domain-containing protein [Haematococcus lacustris]
MEDIKTVHYATKDPIQNLRIRVSLSRVSVQIAQPPTAPAPAPSNDSAGPLQPAASAAPLNRSIGEEPPQASLPPARTSIEHEPPHQSQRQPEDQRHEAQPAADNDRQPYQDQQPPLPPGRGAALAKQPRMSRVQQASAAPAAAQQGRRQPQLAGPIGEALEDPPPSWPPAAPGGTSGGPAAGGPPQHAAQPWQAGAVLQAQQPWQAGGVLQAQQPWQPGGERVPPPHLHLQGPAGQPGGSGSALGQGLGQGLPPRQLPESGPLQQGLQRRLPQQASQQQQQQQQQLQASNGQQQQQPPASMQQQQQANNWQQQQQVSNWQQQQTASMHLQQASYGQQQQQPGVRPQAPGQWQQPSLMTGSEQQQQQFPPPAHPPFPPPLPLPSHYHPSSITAQPPEPQHPAPSLQPPHPAPPSHPPLLVDPATGLPLAPPFILPDPRTHTRAPDPPAPPLPPRGLPPPSASGPPKLDVTRVFSWQEKVPGRREVWEAAQHTAAAAAAAAQTTAQLGAEGAAQGPGQLGGQGGRGRRTRALGSQTSGGEQQGGRRTTLAAAGAHGEGSLLFTYVHSDEFCDQEELSKTVTTSNYEHENPLYNRLMSNPKHRQEVLNFRTMYIMASLGPEEEIPDPQYDRVLVCIKAYPDGSFDMRPGFSRPGRKYRFEDALGGIYEYRVEDVSAKAEPSLARRTAALQRQVAARALELRKPSIGAARFQPPPSDQQSMRLVLLGELLGCADFTRDRLYLEYSLRFDPALWEMATTSWAAHEPGLYKGVTACSRMTQYPPDPELGGPGRWVGHWGHPLEAELVSRGEPPPPAKYPALFFQVCSYDLRDRYTSQGYGWLGLAPFVPGSHTQYVQCWRPLASLRDQQQEFFIGGSVELQDVNYLERGHMGGGSCPPPPLKHVTSQGQQSGGKGNALHLLNKYGLRTETTGVIKVRLHALTQRWDAATEEALQGGAMGREGEAGAGSLTAAPFATRTPSKRNKRDLSLAAVVERARSRLKDARGGDVALRPGVVSAAPGIRRGPQDCRVQEGAMVELRVEAVGMEPLKYQWYRDDRKLTVATADSDILIIAEARPLDAGAYHCQVSNKDGAVNSPKAMVKVDKLPRMARASGAYAAHDEVNHTSLATRHAPCKCVCARHTSVIFVIQSRRSHRAVDGERHGRRG